MTLGTEISERDCRLEGFRAGLRRYTKITHLPTGVVVEFANAVSKREILRELKKAVAERVAR